MKLEHLTTFDAVARLGNFTLAADELFITQPSLSRQIMMLEGELGVQLFERGRHGATLTDAGERLLPIARRMLADADTALVEMNEVAGLRQGRVRLGAPPTLCGTVVADALAAFHAAHPGVDLEIVEAGSRALVDRVVDGSLDFALTITRGKQRFEAVESEPLFTERLVVAAGGATALAPQLTLAELADVPLIAFNASYDLRLATDLAFSAAGLTPRIAVAGGEMDAVLRFVERGIGVAVVPATVLLDRPALTGARLVQPELVRTVAISQRAGAKLSHAAAALRSIVCETTDHLMAPSSPVAGLLIPAR